MANLLYRMGAAALLPRKKAGGQVLPALIDLDTAMRLREKFYQEGQVWPYEHIVPGLPQPPKGSEAYLKRQKAKELKKQARLKEVQDAMAQMPQLVEQYRAVNRLCIPMATLLSFTRASI
ncbi:hypothetical protein QJQ45_027876 [Haematococcus lacustris]|nr:hypothetical protein QJQ45_027876 [Haematococcus lacustris]